MADKITLDSNVLIYAFASPNDPRKELAKQVLTKCSVISIQAINETAFVLNRKLNFTPVSLLPVIQFLKEHFLITDLSISILDITLNLMKKNNFSFWDNMMIASALQNQCTIFYSEDLRHGQVIEDKLKIINPFVFVKK